MATLEQCRAAVEGLAEKMRTKGGGDGLDNRTLSAHVPDLDVTFHGKIAGGQLENITTDPQDKAQIRLTAASDDLVALTAGELDVASAWLSKRIKIEASMLDLLKLKSMF